MRGAPEDVSPDGIGMLVMNVLAPNEFPMPMALDVATVRVTEKLMPSEPSTDGTAIG